MADIPNLAGVATSDLVQQIGGGSFKASYINWARTLNLLHQHAPGWMPELVTTADGGIVHSAPVGAFLLIRFRHLDGTLTPPVPQAFMDQHNKSIPVDKIDSRDVTDTHVRGVCKAAAFTFGLAYELWAKMPLESGYADKEEEREETGQPTSGVWHGVTVQRRIELEKIAALVREHYDAEDLRGGLAYLERQELGVEEKTCVWTLLPSNIRSALKVTAQTINQLEHS